MQKTNSINHVSSFKLDISVTKNFLDYAKKGLFNQFQNDWMIQIFNKIPTFVLTGPLIGLRDCVIGHFLLRDCVKTVLFLRDCVKRHGYVMRESQKFST